MDSILFILVLACLLLVAGWYVGAEMRGDNGEHGLLGIVSKFRSEVSKGGPSYRERRRHAATARQASAGERDDAEEPAYTAPGDARRFREKEEAGYRARGPLPRFGERAAVRPDEDVRPAADEDDEE